MKKLFKNCPEKKRKCCGGCPLLKQCILKKVLRIIKSKSRDICLNTIMIISLIGIVFQINSIIKLNNNSNSEEQKITTTIQEVNKSSNLTSQNEVRKPEVDGSEIIIFAKPEETPKAKISADGPSDNYYYQISDSEKKDLEKLVYQESRGESLEGKVAVAAVVLNRYVSKDELFNTTSISKIVTQSGQFADISTVTQEQLDTVPECNKAVELALKGWDPTRKGFSEGAKYFYEPNTVVGYQKEIREGIEVYKIGNHNFHNDFNN